MFWTGMLIGVLVGFAVVGLIDYFLDNEPDW